uniref:MYND-type domain-containing protein n=1 Tax=Ditylum brightwellii TaxID=49249 RepID=A0A7S4T530_9STRA
MNDENLVYDYRFNVVDEPSEWAFNWDYGECGTSRPTPREHHASMWMTMNVDDPIRATTSLFQQHGMRFGIELHVQNPTEDTDGNYILKVTSKRTRRVLMKGEMQEPDEGGPLNDPNVGHFCYFTCHTEAGFEMMKCIAENTSHGFCALVPHQEVEMMNDGGYRIVAVTGEGPDDHNENNGDNENSNDSDDGCGERGDIATRFTLFDGEEEVARCHMTYRDGSYDPSMGPTIEMIAVKQSRRGEGLAKVLWHHVLRFIETHFALECLNNDAPIGTIMVKAAQITLPEVEMRMTKRDKSLVPLGYKHLLYDYFGFSVREQKGVGAYMFASRRPKDEEAVLYIPLLSKEQLAKKRLTDKRNAPKPGDPFLRSKMGKRSCMYCSKVGMDLMRCAGCEVAVYCNSRCQKLDWKHRHKKWCNKTREELKELMIKEGAMMKLPDGTCSLNMSFGM